MILTSIDKDAGHQQGIRLQISALAVQMYLIVV